MDLEALNSWFCHDASGSTERNFHRKPCGIKRRLRDKLGIKKLQNWLVHWALGEYTVFNYSYKLNRQTPHLTTTVSADDGVIPSAGSVKAL